MSKPEEQIFKRIDKPCLSQKLVRDYAMFTMNNFFYNSVTTYGLENIPKDKPFMIAPNHQNALMDAAAVINAFERPVFIARADLFNNKYLAKFSEWARMMPAFRIRDGKENLHKNTAIFKRSAEILRNGIPMVIFPEASHNNKRRLLPLKKGLARTAFQAEAITDFSLDLYILPVGVYYDNYTNVQTNITIIHGKPFPISEFKEEYLKNEKRALNLFNKKLAEEMKKLIINIENVEYYDSYELMRQMYREEMYEKINLTEKTPLNNLLADKELIKILDKFNEENPDEMKKLHLKVEEYSNGLKKLKLRDWQFKKEKFNSLSLYLQALVMILLLPLNIYGYINNILPIFLQKTINKKFKDTQFHSSIKYIVAIIVTPFIYMLQMVIPAFFTDIWWIKWLYLISLPLSLFFSLHYYTHFIKLRSSLIFKKLSTSKSTLFEKLTNLRKDITNNLKQIVNY